MKRLVLSSQQRWQMSLMILLGLALLCRSLTWSTIIAAWAENGVPVSDARALDMWALNILDGLGFRDISGFWVYEAFRMPFFSVFLAALYALFGHYYFPVRLVLLVMSAATCLGVAGVGRLVFNRNVGFIAGLIYAVYYPMVFYALAYMTETLFTFLFVLGTYLVLRAIHERDWGFALGSGIVFGCAAMTRFAIVVALPVLGLYVLSYPVSPFKRRFRLALVWTIAFFVSFSPWVLRNVLVFKAFFPSESGGTRQMWTAANPEYDGAHYTRNARRIILWADPEASEIERNQRLQQETREFIAANPAWYVNSIEWRISHYLLLPSWHAAVNADNGYQRWEWLSLWFAGWLGTIGFILALVKRPRSGLLLSGIFLMLTLLHGLAGELTRYRLTSEWLWCLGAAYLGISLSQLATRSLLQIETTCDDVLPSSLFDSRIVRWGVPILLLLPFAVLGVKIPQNYAALAHQQLPRFPRPVPEMIAQANLEDPFEQQGRTLHEVGYYIQHAKQQKAPDISYPEHVIIYAGELSHFILRDDGSIKSFSFKINKADHALGDLVVFCTSADDTLLFLPRPLKRTLGVVVGMISGTGGGAGEPSVTVSDIYLEHEGKLISCRPDQE